MSRNRANNERLKANLEAMYAVVLWIYYPVLKYQVCNSEGYEEIDNKQATVTLLSCIKN